MVILSFWRLTIDNVYIQDDNYKIPPKPKKLILLFYLISGIIWTYHCLVWLTLAIIKICMQKSSIQFYKLIQKKFTFKVCFKYITIWVICILILWNYCGYYIFHRALKKSITRQWNWYTKHLLTFIIFQSISIIILLCCYIYLISSIKKGIKAKQQRKANLQPYNVYVTSDRSNIVAGEKNSMTGYTNRINLDIPHSPGSVNNNQIQSRIYSRRNIVDQEIDCLLDKEDFNYYDVSETSFMALKNKGESFYTRNARKLDLLFAKAKFTTGATEDMAFKITYENNLECCICWGNFELGDEVTTLPACKHIFHYECFKDWFVKNGYCPVCNMVIRQQMLEVLYLNILNRNHA